MKSTSSAIKRKLSQELSSNAVRITAGSKGSTSGKESGSHKKPKATTEHLELRQTTLFQDLPLRTPKASVGGEVELLSQRLSSAGAQELDFLTRQASLDATQRQLSPELTPINTIASRGKQGEKVVEVQLLNRDDGEPPSMGMSQELPYSQCSQTSTCTSSSYEAEAELDGGGGGNHGQRGGLPRGKTLQDPIHDRITLKPLLVVVMDTPHFQRLRNLSQLGSSQFLYPGAVHTRFEHSIGVAHLAGRMVRHLRVEQPELQISDCDELCVEVSGLVHDLGHGPFSHVFEHFVNRMRSKQNESNFKKWRHEETSVQLVEILFEEYVKEHALELGLENYEQDLAFVKALVRGVEPDKEMPEDIGRGTSKRFLFDIVANKRNGIDVDKLDYFLRDSVNCFGQLGMDGGGCHISRLIQCARVKEVNGVPEVCFEVKMSLSLRDLFMTRTRLHKYVYQHHTTKVVDLMILDILEAAEDFVRIRGKGGKQVRLSETVEDMVAFTNLGDWIFWALPAMWGVTSIQYGSSPPVHSGDDSSHKSLHKACELMDRLRTRHLYPVVGDALVLGRLKKEELDQLQKSLFRYLTEPGYSPSPMVDSTLGQAVMLDTVHPSKRVTTTRLRKTHGGGFRSPKTPKRQRAAQGLEPDPLADNNADATATATLLSSPQQQQQQPPPPCPAAGTFHPDDFVIDVMRINYGSDNLEEPDPLQHVWFFNPKEPNPQPFQQQQKPSLFTPSAFEEVTIMLYCRRPDDDQEFFDKMTQVWYSWRLLNRHRGIDQATRSAVRNHNPNPGATRTPIRRPVTGVGGSSGNLQTPSPSFKTPHVSFTPASSNLASQQQQDR